MRIALACGFPFLPPTNGVEVRLQRTAEQLAKMGEVLPVLVTTSTLPVDRIAELERTYGQVVVVRPTLPPSRTFQGKAWRLLHPKSVAGRGTQLSPAEAARVRAILSSCDAVWFHSLKVADSLGIQEWPNAVLDLDDLHSDKYRQLSKLDGPLKERLSNAWSARLWRLWEKDTLNRFHKVVVCSEDDRRKLGDGARVVAIPNTLEPPARNVPGRPRTDNRIGFVGNLDYHANHDAIEYFIAKVLPAILDLLPSARLRVVGNRPPHLRMPDHPCIDYLGYVPDLAEEMAGWSCSVAPIRVGSGTRIKILDAFRHGCPVVSTALGCSGLDVMHDRELLIADRPGDFAKACVELCRNGDLRERLRAQAQRTWEERFTPEAIAPAFQALLRGLPAACPTP